MTAATTDRLLPEILAGTLTVHIGPGLAGTVVEDIAGDMLNSRLVARRARLARPRQA